MKDDELIELLQKPTTIRAICDKFKITKPTAQAWIARLITEFNCRLVVSRQREGKRGPASKAYQIEVKK
jgi:hypothetical protein